MTPGCAGWAALIDRLADWLANNFADRLAGWQETGHTGVRHACARALLIHFISFNTQREGGDDRGLV